MITEEQKYLLSQETLQRRADILSAIAEPTRLRILDFLHIHGGTVTVRDITDVTLKEQPTVSHHLRILRSAGIIGLEKRGLEAFYYINKHTLENAIGYIRDMYPIQGEQ